MLRKYWPFLALIIIILGSFFVYKQVSDYRAEQRLRVEALQKKAEEVKVTIIEGWTIKQMAQKFEDAGMFSAEEFLKVADNFDASEFPLVQKPKRTSLEGYLFPDTYRFAKGSTPDDVIKKMLANFSSRVSSLGVDSAGQDFIINGYENLSVTGGDNEPGLSLYDILTLASIIEEESGGKGPMSLSEERALVSGVFYNRLLIGQGLESDATVNYITGKNTPGVSTSDTQINSPYNTYRYAGLPPGPIGAPSLGSLQAALRPTKSDYFYFLHRQPSGEVVFSKTFSEHTQARQ